MSIHTQVLVNIRAKENKIVNLANTSWNATGNDIFSKKDPGNGILSDNVIYHKNSSTGYIIAVTDYGKRPKLALKDNYTIAAWVKPLIWDHGASVITESNNSYYNFGPRNYNQLFYGARFNSAWFNPPPGSKEIQTVLGSWVHMAVCGRKPEGYSLFVNGEKIISNFSENGYGWPISNTGINFCLGATACFDDIVLLNGVALFTDDFPKPTKYLTEEYDIIDTLSVAKSSIKLY